MEDEEIHEKESEVAPQTSIEEDEANIYWETARKKAKEEKEIPHVVKDDTNPHAPGPIHIYSNPTAPYSPPTLPIPLWRKHMHNQTEQPNFPTSSYGYVCYIA